VLLSRSGTAGPRRVPLNVLGELAVRERVRRTLGGVDSPGSFTCALCGATVSEIPLTWVSSVERGRTVYYCDVCSREHLRSIEAKLDSEHW